METAKITARIIAPEDTLKPFCVTLQSICGTNVQTEYVHANDSAVFFVPDGHYMLCFKGGCNLTPGGQCKWIHAHAGQAACYSAVFQTIPKDNTATVIARDRHYPNLIPITGGITFMNDIQPVYLNFTNGTARATLPIGHYTFVASSIPGYTDAEVTDFDITAPDQTVTVYLTAQGTLNVKVTDPLNNNITSGSVNLANAEGTAAGNAEDIEEDGTAVFENVPYGTAANPITFLIDQTESDDTHAPIEEPETVTMTRTPTNIGITNERLDLNVVVNAVDDNYPNLVPLNGTLTFSGNLN